MVSTNTRNLSSILELSDLMLDTAADMCDADGWFFYNVNDDKFLTLSYSVNKSLKITRRGSDNLVYAPTVFLPEIKNQPQKSIAAACFFSKGVINSNNIYADNKFDNSFFAEFDEDNNYATVSVLSIPVTTRRGYVVGIAQFVNPRDESGPDLYAGHPEKHHFNLQAHRSSAGKQNA